MNSTIPFTCPSCGNERMVQKYKTLMTNFTGYCAACKGVPRRGKPVKGGRYTGNGYVNILATDHPSARPSDGYILEHRLVMEKMIGRCLEPYETVHHKDGNRSNNDPSNLELWTTKHGKGVRSQDLEGGLLKAMYYQSLFGSGLIGLSE